MNDGLGGAGSATLNGGGSTVALGGASGGSVDVDERGDIVGNVATCVEADSPWRILMTTPAVVAAITPRAPTNLIERETDGFGANDPVAAAVVTVRTRRGG